MTHVKCIQKPCMRKLLRVDIHHHRDAGPRFLWKYWSEAFPCIHSICFSVLYRYSGSRK